MANATVSRLGQTLGAGDAEEIFLKVFPGEVLTFMNEKNVMSEKTRSRNINNGKEAQFPALGKTTATYHTVGEEILGKVIQHNEGIIPIDGLLESDAFIAVIDEAMNHYEIRQDYAKQLGEALALLNDKHILQIGLLGARTSTAIVPGAAGGVALTNAAFATTGSALGTGLFDAGVVLDNNSMDSADRFVALKPAQVALLVQDNNNLDKDIDGDGSRSRGVIGMLAGIQVVKSVNVPVTNITTDLTKYNGDFSTTVGLVWQREAIATVNLLSPTVDQEFDLRRMGTLIVAHQAAGHGFLRTEGLVELKTA